MVYLFTFQNQNFLVAFAKQLQNVTVIFLLSVRLAGFPYRNNLLPRNRFLCNFVFVIFTKTCPHAQMLLKV